MAGRARGQGDEEGKRGDTGASVTPLYVSDVYISMGETAGKN